MIFKLVLMISKLNILTIILIFFIVNSNLISSPNNEVRMQATVTPSFIQNDELPNIILNALNGDHEDTRRLISNYSGRNDSYNAIVWSLIGAENGHLESIYSLVARLRNNSSFYGYNVRSIYWLYRMAVIDYRDSVRLLGREGFTIASARPPDEFDFTLDVFEFNDTHISLYKLAALQGSINASRLLGEYYEKIELNLVRAEYWYRIGCTKWVLK